MLEKEIRANSKEIRKCVKELLEDDKAYTISEIREYVEEKTGKKFSDGQLSGVLARLVQSGDYINGVRGCYTKAIEKPDISEISANIFNDAIKKVMAHVNKIDIINISFEDVKKIRNIKETINIVKERIDIKE